MDEQFERMKARINELEQICAESYQVVGILAHDCDRFHDESVIKALDNLADTHLIHKDVLPFPSATEELIKWRMSKEYLIRTVVVIAFVAAVAGAGMLVLSLIAI